MTRNAINRWKGGQIQVVERHVVYDHLKDEEAGGKTRPVYAPRLVTKRFTAEAVPYGRGLALILDPKRKRPDGSKWASMQLPSGLWMDVEVRDGRPQCVGLRSGPEGPEITSKDLRFAFDRELSYLIESLTVRLKLNRAGNVIGVRAVSPQSPVERRTVKQRTADLRSRYARPAQRRGRRPLSEDHLREVLEVAANAAAQKQAASAAIAERWKVTPATARQWLYKARKRAGKESDA